MRRRLALALSASFIGIAANHAVAEPIVRVSLVPDVLDYGWNGFGHDRRLPHGKGATLVTLKRCDDTLSPCTSNAQCASGACVSTCNLGEGICELSGPRERPRCVRDMAPCSTNADCGSSGRCAAFIAPPIPASSANHPVCITAFAATDITGTYDPATGESALATELRLRVHLGVAADAPCPRCGAPDENPKIGGTFTCSAGSNAGAPCTVEGVSAVFGGVSSDCPPDPTANVSGSGLAMRLPEITTGTTHREAQMPCMQGGICTDSHEQCSTNADCKRCTDDLNACTSNADCAGGRCAAAPDQPISCGSYCHCGFCDDDPALPCFSESDCADGQACTAGDASTGIQEKPNRCEDLVCGRDEKERCCSRQCEEDQQPCNVNADCASGQCSATADCPEPTLLRGECTLKRYLVCVADSECAFQDAGTCDLQKQPCFENRISREGKPSRSGRRCIDDATVGECLSNDDCSVGACVSDTSAMTYVALACLGMTTSAGVNYGPGIPGPAAISFIGTGLASVPEPTTTTTNPTTTTIPTSSTTLPFTVCGDVTGEGSITASDALLILQAAVGLGSCPHDRCDINGDDELTASDALMVLRGAIGLSDDLTCGA